ncbi:MAG: hydrolase [Candidatus Roseilinea sp.]|nr:MAG: hydrolase [Candidatus Roseilinea sp.]
MSCESSTIAVIFDMDGLMLDTEALAREAWFETMRRWGYTLTDDVYLRVLGTTGARTRDIFREAFGPNIPIEAMYDHKQRYVDEAIASGRIAVKPGLVELLDWLDAQRIPKAVASSTARALVLKKLGLVNLAARFDAIVGGDEVAHGKPAPDIFLEAARRLNVLPCACVVLEDSENGVRAAHAAGMHVIMVPDLKPPDDDVRALADHVLPSLHEAQRVLRAITDEQLRKA